ncbi:hypothetical protein GEMRC1_003497 [Eukaryota sp. GEM-RC1]
MTFQLSLLKNDDSTGVSLLSFPTNAPKSAFVDSDSTSYMEFNRYATNPASRKRRSKVLVAARSDDQFFLGNTTSSISSHPFTYAVGHVDLSMKKINVYPVEQVIPMTPQLKSHLKEDSAVSKRDRLQELVSTFGSRRRKQDLKAKIANTLDESSMDHSAELVEELAENLDASPN